MEFVGFTIIFIYQPNMIWCIANTLITASHACVGKLVEWLEWGHARGGKRFIAIFFFLLYIRRRKLSHLYMVLLLLRSILRGYSKQFALETGVCCGSTAVLQLRTPTAVLFCSKKHVDPGYISCGGNSALYAKSRYKGFRMSDVPVNLSLFFFAVHT